MVGEGVTPLTVARRWRALSASGVAWLTAYPDRRFWDRHTLGWIEMAPPLGDIPPIVDALVDVGRVPSVDVHPGGVLASVLAADLYDLGQWLRTGPLRLPVAETHLAVRQHTRASWWRVGALPPDTFDTGVPEPSGPPPPDDWVRQMLAALAPDPRRPVAKLAADLKKNESWVRRWLTSMLADGDLDIRCEVVPAAVGRQVGLHWWLRAPDPEALANVLIAQPGVRWVIDVVSTTGATTLTAAWLPDVHAIHTLTARVAGRYPDAETVRLVLDMMPAKRLGWVVSRSAPHTRVRYVPLDI